jgi:hypothetical protein
LLDIVIVHKADFWQCTRRAPLKADYGRLLQPILLTSFRSISYIRPAYRAFFNGRAHQIWWALFFEAAVAYPSADVAQLVEQSIRNRQVTSSTLVVGSIISITYNILNKHFNSPGASGVPIQSKFF